MYFTLNFIPEAFECWPFFDLRSRDMTSLKRHFLKDFSMDFAQILFEDAKLMLNKVGTLSFPLIPALVFRTLRKIARAALCPLPSPANGGLTQHRLGHFRTHDSRGRGRTHHRGEPPCYLENQWSYRAPRDGVRKLSTSSSQSMLKILRLTLSFGSRSGQRSNFDVSV